MFERFPDRFPLGSDTWNNERRGRYPPFLGGYRPWLNQLPPLVAQKIAWGKAVRRFDLKL